MITDDIKKLIASRDVNSIADIMFEQGKPKLKNGFQTENEVWDYKKSIAKAGKKHLFFWAKIATHVLAFYNSGGGILIFGIDDKSYAYHGCNEDIDSKKFNDQIRKFLSDKIWVEFHRLFIDKKQRYLGLAIIPSRGIAIEKFTKDSPETNGNFLFKEGWSAKRENDSTLLLDITATATFKDGIRKPAYGRIYEVDEDYYRILAPDYDRFVMRSELCKKIVEGLSHPRTSVTSLIGIGGVGKTALATWAALESYKNSQFEFIVSMTAKDRELSSTGIIGIEPSLNSYESLLDDILKVLGFPAYKDREITDKEKYVKELLTNSNGLIYVDNLETVDDIRIINFLDELPIGVKALTTSRKTRVRVSVYPIDVHPMKSEEVFQYLKSLSNRTELRYLNKVSKEDAENISSNCDGIPLAVAWSAQRCSQIHELLSYTNNIKGSGKHGEELVEFSYRRIFDDMSASEKMILDVLCIFNKPIPEDVIIVGSDWNKSEIQDSIEDLVRDTLIQRFFDSDLNDYTYSLLPITRGFVYSELSKDEKRESIIRSRMTSYYEATDIKDPETRQAVRTIRQGKKGSDQTYVDLATTARKSGDRDGAEKFFLEAINRNQNNWRAHQLLAELYRHDFNNQTKAIQHYETAARYAPKSGKDKALIFRELGILYKSSGAPNATDQALDCLQVALEEEPNDRIAAVTAATLYNKKGHYNCTIDLIEPMIDSAYGRDRAFMLLQLVIAYKRIGDFVNEKKYQAEYDKVKSIYTM